MNHMNMMATRLYLFCLFLLFLFVCLPLCIAHSAVVEQIEVKERDTSQEYEKIDTVVMDNDASKKKPRTTVVWENKQEKGSIQDMEDSIIDEAAEKWLEIEPHVADTLEIFEALDFIESEQFDNAISVLESFPENPVALFHLAEIHLMHKFDPHTAFPLYQLSAKKGYPDSQHKLAFFYGIGLGVEQDESLAVLYDYFAAMGNNPEAQVAMGYRHSMGYGVPKSCTTAVRYYTDAAIVVVDEIVSDHVGPVINRARLTNEVNRSPLRNDDEDVIQYYEQSAQNGDVNAQVALGRLHLFGARNIPQDATRAAGFLRQAVRQGNAEAKAMLGMMNLNGMGMKANNETAFELFTSAAESGNAIAQNGLGVMYLNGYGCEKSPSMALKMFKKSSNQGNSEAQFNLGTLYYTGEGVVKMLSTAMKYFSLAANQGHTRAMYNLALMYLEEKLASSCSNALRLLKTVSERGSWVKDLNIAHAAFLKGDINSAFYRYANMANLGIEVAQENAAWILDTEKDISLGTHDIDDSKWLVHYDSNKDSNTDSMESSSNDNNEIVSSTAKHQERNIEKERRKLALHFFILASEQGNVDAIRRIGDYRYYGLVDNDEVDLEKAYSYYQLAAKNKNAQAMFNMGIMHEHGLGAKQDFYRAKSFYESAMSSNGDAYIPVQLALMKLWFHQSWIEFMQDSPPSDVPAEISEVNNIPQDSDLVIFMINLYLNWENVLLAFLCVIFGVLVVFRATL